MIEFEIGPSCGFHAPKGSICTMDLVQYMRIDDNWYRLHSYDTDEMKKILTACTDELEFQAEVKKLIEDKKIILHEQ